jgi:hypothetical protein
VRFVGRGHPSVRATHGKTLEFGVDDEITARASCVIAVGSRHDADLAPAGPLRLTIRAADAEPVVIRAIGNPNWDPRGPAVIRRSPLRLPGTLATEADTAAADLPRALVAALASADAVVEVDVSAESVHAPTVVLVLADPAAPDHRALRAELAVADAVVGEDIAARGLVRERGAAVTPTDGQATRTLVVATMDLPGAAATALLADSTVRVETIGLPPAWAAAAATPSRAPVVLAVEERPRAALRAAPPGQRLVVRCPPDDVPALLAFAAELRGEAPVVAAQPFAPPVRGTAANPPAPANDDPVHLCFAPAGGELPLDPAVVEAVRALLADGVPTRTAAQALAALTGRSRRDAYALALQLGNRS